MIVPLPFDVRIIFAPRFESVRVDVAVMAPPKNEVPETYVVPCTAKPVEGEVVPTPTLPFVSIVIFTAPVLPFQNWIGAILFTPNVKAPASIPVARVSAAVVAERPKYADCCEFLSQILEA